MIRTMSVYRNQECEILWTLSKQFKIEENRYKKKIMCVAHAIQFVRIQFFWFDVRSSVIDPADRWAINDLNKQPKNKLELILFF